MSKESSRIENTARNIYVSLLVQAISMIFGFISRSVFLKYLSVDLLGVNGLFTNILSVLSLAELGISNVMLFSLYEPVSNNDGKRIKNLLNFYHKLYLVIALVIMVLGLLLLPFLPYIVNTENHYEHLRLYYVLILINSVMTYFILHKRAFLQANQEIFVIKRGELIANIFRHIMQIIVVVTLRNFIIYLIIPIIASLISNIYITHKANKELDAYKSVDADEDSIDTKPIIKNIKATFLYKVSVLAIHNTDDITIGFLFGTSVLGYYSNYQLIIHAIDSAVQNITNSIIPSLGNLNTEKSEEKSSKTFFTLLLFYHFLAAATSICLLLLLNDFISIWLNSSFVLNKIAIILMVINFYQVLSVSIVWMFRETLGLFVEIKKVILMQAGLNIAFSLLLGKFFGISGIIASSIISRTITTYWFEPRILFKRLNVPVSMYWRKTIKYIFISLLAFLINYLITPFFGKNLIALIIRGLIYVIITFAIYTLITYKTPEFKKLKSYAKDIINKFLKKDKANKA